MEKIPEAIEGDWMLLNGNNMPVSEIVFHTEHPLE